MITGRKMTADNEFFAMADAVNGMKVSTRKDAPAWAEAVRTLGEVSDARGDRAVFVSTRMPALLRALLYIAHGEPRGGHGSSPFQAVSVGVAVLVITVVISLLVFEVIDDLDDPFGGAWAISTEPLQRIQFVG